MQIQGEPYHLHIHTATPSSQCMEFAISSEVTLHHAQMCTEGMVEVLLVQDNGMA